MPRRAPLFALPILMLACGSSDGAAPADAGADVADPHDLLRPPPSCAYDCPQSDCAELTSPYACPAVGAWSQLPHDDACGAWDGTYPSAPKGACTVSAASGDAAKYAGTDPDDAQTIILPDGRRIRPAGADWVFAENDLQGGLTTAIAPVAGTHLVLTVDDGPGDHAVRVVDTTRIGSGNPVVGYVKFADPSTLNQSIAFLAPDLVYVATDDGVVRAMKLDTASGAIAIDDARTITLPPSTDSNGKPTNWYVASVAASPDGKRLVVTGVTEKKLLVYDVASRQEVGSVDLGGNETFGAFFDPNDPTGRFVYVSMWADRALVEVDVSNPSAPQVTRRFSTGKDPQGVAFLDGRWIAVTSDLSDALTLVDRTTGSTSTVPVDTSGALAGAEPSTLAWDATQKRLYVALSGLNAIGAYAVDLAQTPPQIAPAGKLPTGFWPSGVVVQADGSIAVANMRGHGTGPRPLHFDVGNSDIDMRMRGGVQRIPSPSAADLTDGDALVAKYDSLAQLAGAPKVDCPPGAHDFPIPASIDQGPSSAIQHVFFIVRENKGFDGLFGDVAGANGDASYLLKTAPGQMDLVWKNLRALARTFAISDNYYTDAIYSTQGHTWTAWGRSNDFDERTWAIAGGGRDARPIPPGGVFDPSRPIEGSLFDWLAANHVPYDLLGEFNGSPLKDDPVRPAVDPRYPGGPIANISYNDLEKACYAAGRVRLLCNIGNFVYMTLPNDHTFGISPTRATPESYCAVNDEATGMIVDAISHSPLWASSLIVITEDDPSQGGEHVDSHRAPLVMISPWVERGTVSKQHIDVASLHKLFAHVLGKPYRNRLIADAPLPLDMFTSTPDFTPYTYAPRAFPLACGKDAQAGERRLTASWDFENVDEQPGLDAQVTRWMRGAQLVELPPKLLEAVEVREAKQRARGAR